MKILTILLLIIMPFTASAEVQLRTFRSNNKIKTYTPTFSIKEIKNNKLQNKHFTERNNISYLHIDELNQTSAHRQTITGNTKSYYHQYKPATANSQNVVYNNHMTIKSYNVANRTPFESDNAIVNTRFIQYSSQMGPPTDGSTEESPISDAIAPLLLLAGIYLVIKYRQ